MKSLNDYAKQHEHKAAPANLADYKLERCGFIRSYYLFKTE
jgi:hypothetical protein